MQNDRQEQKRHQITLLRDNQVQQRAWHLFVPEMEGLGAIQDTHVALKICK